MIKKLILASALFFSVFSFGYNLLSTEGLKVYYDALDQQNSLKNENFDIAQQNQFLAEKINLFYKKQDLMEFNIRKELGWIAEDDIILKFKFQKDSAKEKSLSYLKSF